MTVAILGATGHIGSTLVFFLAKENHIKLECFVRNTDKMKYFLQKNNIMGNVQIHKIDYFLQSDCDAVVNCIGIGSNEVKYLFELTEYYDNLIIKYLHEHPNCKYINFSSGAVYGNEFQEAAGKKETKIPPNALTLNYHTTIIKLNSELKHRAFSDLFIVDLRLFAFFSRFLKETEHYLMADIVYALKNGRPFVTHKEEIVRDYISPQDLSAAVLKIIMAEGTNTSMDLYSTKPISKTALLTLCQEEFQMKVLYDNEAELKIPSGKKLNYYTKNYENCFGWHPTYSSKDTILQELKSILK
ncbi:MAG: NAD(P)-dependent oxidoreductase [Clostridium sp.]|nr:NAD(P)-dependent oxidoreductase [Clostridium sp.]